MAMKKKKVAKKKSLREVKSFKVGTISTDKKNSIDIFVKEHAHYVHDVLEARKSDIHNVFRIEREIAELKCDSKLDPSRKKALLKQKCLELKKAKQDAKTSDKSVTKVVNEAIKGRFFDIKTCFSYQQAKYFSYVEKINELRRNGENKVIALRSEIQDIVLNKQIDREQKKKLIAENRKQLIKAKKIAKINRNEVKTILREASRFSRNDFKHYFAIVKANNQYDNNNSRRIYRQMVDTIADMHSARVNELKQKFEKTREGLTSELRNAKSPEKIGELKKKLALNKKAYAVDMKAEKIAYSSKMTEAKTTRNDALNHSKELRYSSFMNRYSFTSQIKNGRHPIGEWAKFKFENYIAHFNPYDWIIKNAIYVLIILVFAALVIYTGGGLLSGESILTALVQISPKIFFALGVGGLILLGGTDLSIGRLTGVGVSFTLMILATTPYPDNNGIIWFNIAGAPPAVKIILALFISILFCTAFTTFAGFFTAKFKMHPFISTLAVQLISYGLFQLFWSATSSFTPDENIVKMLRGPQAILLVVYAAIAILIVWFIWNKTKFGKHIYAVGGNQEAATVSGISPLKITILAFVMAGILYGFGGFIQAIQTGTGNFNSGYGTETDAIAACVIGGISFSGGVGKVSGAVIGAIILGFLTHAFGYIGVDSNLQLLIKGIIILIAVALDCVKYLKKK